ncbi:hypothetical protein PAT3040_05805 [Paenibacillus agaridevorans]|uniref:Sigma-70 family RNA polymerase sigma factor n=1 Tax=Paenibacillus agaridevorans TaxID=171404 RepID=A0A2R5EWE8_9BACL|nr:hypothetical protein PAT3040_05805 [Paenibacillus agaridevorans]
MSDVNYYKKELQRIAWRLQYKARSTRKRECSWMEYNHPYYHPFEMVDNRIFVQQLLAEIQPGIGRKIIHGLFIKNQTETQLAKELNISQQGVNKWKRKTLKSLSQKMSL